MVKDTLTRGNQIISVYELKPPECKVALPILTKVIGIQSVCYEGNFILYLICLECADHSPYRERIFHIFRTGELVPTEGLRYLGSAKVGEYPDQLYHVFERPIPSRKKPRAGKSGVKGVF